MKKNQNKNKKHLYDVNYEIFCLHHDSYIHGLHDPKLWGLVFSRCSLRKIQNPVFQARVLQQNTSIEMTLSGFLLNRKYTCESVFDVELSKRQTKYKLKLMCMKYNYESCIVELRAVCTSTAECRTLVS